jgi:hypothetical protein
MSSVFIQGKCSDCGSTVHGPQRGQHTNFHSNFIHRAEVKDGFAVSAVKWCDPGDHAFKANSPGAQSLDIMQRDGDGGEERVTMDICGGHAFATTPKSSVVRELETAHNDAVALAELQEKYNRLMRDRLATPMNAEVIDEG